MGCEAVELLGLGKADHVGKAGPSIDDDGDDD